MYQRIPENVRTQIAAKVQVSDIYPNDWNGREIITVRLKKGTYVIPDTFQNKVLRYRPSNILTASNADSFYLYDRASIAPIRNTG